MGVCTCMFVKRWLSVINKESSLCTSSVPLWETVVCQDTQTYIKSVYNEEDGVCVSVCAHDYHPVLVYFFLFRFQV